MIAPGTMGTVVPWTAKPLPSGRSAVRHALCRIKAEGGATRQEDRIDGLNGPVGGQKLRLPRAGAPPITLTDAVKGLSAVRTVTPVLMA
jgi:hypothetical protein